MPATEQSIEHWLGDSKRINVPIKDASGNAVNLAGASARWWVGKTARSTGADVLIKKEAGPGLTLANVEGFWTVQISLDPEDTEAMSSGTYYHELEIIEGDGTTSTVTVGPFKLNPTMVRPA